MEMSVMRLVFKLSIFTCIVSNLKICLTHQVTLHVVGHWSTRLFGSH